MFELFCGPDKSPWISVSYDTHRQALDTFREAARRDDSRVGFQCFSRSFKRRNGIRGSFEFAVFWEKLKEQAPIHLLGNAEVEGPTEERGGRVRYVLERAGYRIEVFLIEQIYTEIAYYMDGEIIEGGDYPRSLAPHVRVVRNAADETFTARIEVEAEVDLEDLDLSKVHRAGVGRQWKIDHVGLENPPD